jgi:hypothetical protein
MLDPDATLILAGELAARPDEPAQRAAIGRAYYAVAHRACAIALAAGIFAERPNLHAVWGKLAALQGQSGWSAVAYAGFDLKDMRIDADYEIAYPGDLAAASQEAVALARELIVRMEALPPPAGVR